MSVRAGIVVTGTEVLGGLISDANGPWLADRLLELGIDPRAIGGKLRVVLEPLVTGLKQVGYDDLL